MTANNSAPFLFSTGWRDMKLTVTPRKGSYLGCCHSILLEELFNNRAIIGFKEYLPAG
jgi:hypothetical protein